MMNWFFDTIGLSERNLQWLNGFNKIRENEDLIEFRVTPLMRINRVLIERNGETFNLTFFRKGFPILYRKDVKGENMQDTLEAMTGVSFG